MRQIAMLWLALMSALTVVSHAPQSLRGGPSPLLAFVAEPAADGSRREPRVAPAPPAHTIDGALRASGSVAGIRTARAHAHAVRQATDSPSSMRHWRAGFQSGSALALRRMGACSHGVDARGSVAPYYSTAPPAALV